MQVNSYTQKIKQINSNIEDMKSNLASMKYVKILFRNTIQQFFKILIKKMRVVIKKFIPYRRRQLKKKMILTMSQNITSITLRVKNNLLLKMRIKKQ